MTAAEFRSIRLRLGLTQPQLARVLGYARVHSIAYFEGETASSRRVPHQAALLMRAYADGYRPADWPVDDEDEDEDEEAVEDDLAGR